MAELERQASAPPAAAPQTVSALGFQLKFGGYVQGEFTYDDNYDLGLNTGGIGGITPDTPEESHSRIHANQSRIGVRGTQQTDIGTLDFNLEGDFYGGGGGQFRLRQAYGSWTGESFTLLAGQTWSVFGTGTGYSTTGPLDFNGAMGAPGPRVAQFRVGYKFTDEFQGLVSVEEDNKSIFANRVAFAGAVKWTQGKNGFSASLLSRQLEWSGGTTDGYGFNIGAQYEPWTGGLLQGSATTGKGIVGWIQEGGFATLMPTTALGPNPAGLFELGLDGEAVKTNSYTVGVIQALNEQFEAAVTYGRQDYDEVLGTTGDSVDNFQSVHLTLRYKPVANVLAGLEYIHMEKNLVDGTSLENGRILALVRFTF